MAGSWRGVNSKGHNSSQLHRRPSGCFKLEAHELKPGYYHYTRSWHAVRFLSIKGGK